MTPGRDPGLLIHSFGQGKGVWVACPIESSSEQVNAKLFLSVLRELLSGPLWFEVDVHPAVEMTLFHQEQEHRLLAGLLNMQQQLPPIPVSATVRIKAPPGRRATKVVRLPEQKTIPFEKVGPYAQFRLEPFQYVAMALMEYE